jgi:hypothetical protein
MIPTPATPDLNAITTVFFLGGSILGVSGQGGSGEEEGHSRIQTIIFWGHVQANNNFIF